MQFNRVHIEVTNICSLACSFCPPKLQPVKSMNLDFFSQTLTQLQAYTKSLAFHVMGDPLTLSNLKDYLDLAYQKGFEVELTTSGYYLSKTPDDSMFHKAVRQLNVSLNAYNKNDLNLSFDDYVNAVLKTCDTKVQNHPKPFINLRLWNLDESCSETEFNALLFERLSAHFNVALDLGEVYKNRPKSIRLDSKVLLHFDSYFQWPSLSSTHDSDATCHGLKSHIGILADGTVVPCCLDGEGVINLGNLSDAPLTQVLNSTRAQNMIKGFALGEAREELCRKCTYKDRFNK